MLIAELCQAADKLDNAVNGPCARHVGLGSIASVPERILPRIHRTWRTYLFWFFWTSVAFFTVYPLCNFITAQREFTLNLYFDQELGIPLVPQFIWIYMSLYVLFLIPPFFLEPRHINVLGRQLIGATFFCGAVYLVMPAELGFERVVPADPLYAGIFAQLFKWLLPHNLVPSLHVVFSALILMTLHRYAQTPIAKGIFCVWLVLISGSTVLVHQHHLIDVIAGLLVAVAFYRHTGRSERHA